MEELRKAESLARKNSSSSEENFSDEEEELFFDAYDDENLARGGTLKCKNNSNSNMSSQSQDKSTTEDDSSAPTSPMEGGGGSGSNSHKINNETLQGAKKKLREISLSPPFKRENENNPSTPTSDSEPNSSSGNGNGKDKGRKNENYDRMKRMEDMRRRLDLEDLPDEGNGDDDVQIDSSQSSQTSSVDGIYATNSNRSTPFKYVDNRDTISLHSGSNNRGRMPPLKSLSDPIPAQSTTPLVVEIRKEIQHEPDLIKSQNGSVVSEIVNFIEPAIPKAPPRRKRKGLSFSGIGDSVDNNNVTKITTSFDIEGKDAIEIESEKETNNTPTSNSKVDKNNIVEDEVDSQSHKRFSSPPNLTPPRPPSPSVSIRSYVGHGGENKSSLENSLEMTMSDKGGEAGKIFVVKAQDEERTRAKNSGPKMLRRTESLPKDVMESINFSFNEENFGGEISLSALKTRKASAMSNLDISFENSKINKSSSFSESNSNKPSASFSSDKQQQQLNLNFMLRTKTDSGKELSDIEILEQITQHNSLVDLQIESPPKTPVLNLDTGERVPLSRAEDTIPKCINPLSLHIMRLTSEYVGDNSRRGSNMSDSDSESLSSKKSSVASTEDGGDTSSSSGGGMKKKTAQIKRFLGTTVKKTMDRAKSLAQHHKNNRSEDVNDVFTTGENSQQENIFNGTGTLLDSTLKQVKMIHSNKGPHDFENIIPVQELQVDTGPVWCMKFSNCGRLLATAGQDRVIRIWVLKDQLAYFQDMRSKNTADKVSPTPSQESIVSQHSQHSAEEMLLACENSDPKAPFVPKPLVSYAGHQADLLDIAWAKSFFLLSSSMDRTVRLWHIVRRECLCCFQHIDFVTAIAFHPRDDRYFLSGSLDGKLRLWNIPDKKVALWNEVTGPNKLITAANFCQNGKFAVIGTYDGRCIFYHTEQLKYHTQIIVHRRKRLTGRKITGIEPVPGEDKILVTSNDSRIRLYDLRDLSLTCKYKGYVNSSSQIKATISQDGKYIVSGSENQLVYIWKTYHDYSKFSSARRDRNRYWEAIRAHNALVTCTAFAPDPDIIVKQIESSKEIMDIEESNNEETESSSTKSRLKFGLRSSTGSASSSTSLKHQQQRNNMTAYHPLGYVLVSADFSGAIKVFLKRVKPKHSSLPASALA